MDLTGSLEHSFCQSIDSKINFKDYMLEKCSKIKNSEPNDKYFSFWGENQIEIDRSQFDTFQVFPGVHFFKNLHTSIGRGVCLFPFSF